MIPYEGAGNRTPVLDISVIPGIAEYAVDDVRRCLERNYEFRSFLQKNGMALQADSVMLFYRKETSEYEYVTFVGEPNASLDSNFSEMCGNGIRALGLHLSLITGTNILRIWAGSVKTVSILHTKNSTSVVTVDMDMFQTSRKALQRYIAVSHFPNVDNFSSVVLPGYEFLGHVGIGFNGMEKGEPHVACIIKKDMFEGLLDGFLIREKDSMSSLRKLTSCIGAQITFATDLFPQGINFNIGIIENEKIFVATHERNIATSFNSCQAQQKRFGICRCCTLACGTGGAAVANIAVKHGFVKKFFIETKHSGGKIVYDLRDHTTIMRGEARKKSRPGSFLNHIFV